jgi:hypothetical protein
VGRYFGTGRSRRGVARPCPPYGTRPLTGARPTRRQAASCEHDGFAALARVLRGDATRAALRKADFLHLTRAWGYASDVWCAPAPHARTGAARRNGPRLRSLRPCPTRADAPAPQEAVPAARRPQQPRAAQAAQAVKACDDRARSELCAAPFAQAAAAGVLRAELSHPPMHSS